MTPRVVLIGLPGSGKTTSGRRLANLLGVTFADSDQLIEAQTGRAVPAIFERDGEAGFRRIEAEVIANALGGFDGVLALGGGAVLTEATRVALAESGVRVVLLRSSIRSLSRRVGDGRGRPLLAGDSRQRLVELSAAREPIYRAAATDTVSTDRRSSSKVAADIAALLRGPVPSDASVDAAGAAGGSA
jgi:shikimate kinase